MVGPEAPSVLPALLNSGFTRLDMKPVRFGQVGTARRGVIAPELETIVVQRQSRGSPACLRRYLITAPCILSLTS